jgi:hypothetical protein
MDVGDRVKVVAPADELLTIDIEAEAAASLLEAQYGTIVKILFDQHPYGSDVAEIRFTEAIFYIPLRMCIGIPDDQGKKQLHAMVTI